MNKKTIIKTVLGLAVIVSLSANAFFFGRQWFYTQQQKALNSGALQMRELIFNSVSKGDIQLSDAKGEKTITITINKK